MICGDLGRHKAALCDDKSLKMVLQISLNCALCVGPENLGNKNGESCVPSSSQEQATPKIPVKKQTRQWAAWTRQEEERFFAALRQVGKNFEKLTCRVQSKNKDQVRHYYYRFVRRMNKLLGPNLCLDTKNSKDTNVAMLRWWSLLEKYSCKASILRLKSRRLNLFVEALENQLMKDQEKNRKKGLSTGEINSSVPNISSSNQVGASGHDSCAEKMGLVNRQNFEKVGTGKGALIRCQLNARANCKVESASVKIAKSWHKTGLVAISAYKRWEKAAIAGVSLVADAAEHLERVNTNKENNQETPDHDATQRAAVTNTSQISPQIMLNEDKKSAKLKLQLLPMDGQTRKALEMACHNPHLELTLSTRKRISSVWEHLNRKWGNSISLSGELILFPSWIQKENLVMCQKWTKDSTLRAADVYHLIGSPPTFRLRYGWFSKPEIKSAAVQTLPCTTSEHNLNSNMITKQNIETENQGGFLTDQLVTRGPIITMTPPCTSMSIKTLESGCLTSNISASTYHCSSQQLSTIREEVENLAFMRRAENLEGPAVFAGEWADSLTDISIGNLLSESIPNMDVNCIKFPRALGSSSFDAAIAVHIYKHQNKVILKQDLPAPHVLSIWDAEETCDAFASQKMQNQDAFAFPKMPNQDVSMNDSVEDRKLTTFARPEVSDDEVEELPEAVKLDDCQPGFPSGDPNEVLGGHSDIYWGQSGNQSQCVLERS